ncbi:MAG: YraN family protein [Candidatus Limiplasma sp.]|nr:YraN family protein [Candidatus Limiplasma sp.]
MPEGTYEKGLRGEAEAIVYCIGRGMELLQRRFHSPFGEIDAVLRDGDTLVLLEVKARRTGGAGAGFLAVDRRKQAHLTRAALHYLSLHPWEGPIRFDVAEITADGVCYVQDAFQASELH